MLLAWLLPQDGSPPLTDGWTRTAYQPRHVRPSLVMRASRLLAERRVQLATVGNVSLDSGIGQSTGER
jgi:hypothetical protein